jgi:hypothetical protein
MTTSEGVETPADSARQPREAILRSSSRGWRWYAYPGAQHLWGTLLLLPVVGCFALSVHLLGETAEAFMLALPFALVCLVLPLWLMWFYLPKKHRRQQHEELTAALTEKLRAVRFKDGSVSDFSPTGGVLLTDGMALMFDAPRLLGRLFQCPGDGMIGELDWIWSMEDFGHFEVREVPVRGWWQRVRKAFGAKPRTRLGLSAFARRDGPTFDWPLLPDYEAAARKLVAAVNRKLTDRNQA